MQNKLYMHINYMQKLNSEVEIKYFTDHLGVSDCICCTVLSSKMHSSS